MALNRFLICVELRLEWMTCFSFLTFPSAVKLDTMATTAHSFWHLFVLTSSVSSSHPCDFSWNPSWPVTHHIRCTANYWDLHNNHLLRRVWHKFSGLLNTSVCERSVVLFMCSLEFVILLEMSKRYCPYNKLFHQGWCEIWLYAVCFSISGLLVSL